jgi:hypothetical protein
MLTKEFVVPKYLVLYRGGGSEPDQAAEPTPEQQEAVMRAWFEWKSSADDAIVDFGAPTIAVEAGGDIGGFSIVQADGVEALDAVFESNPHRRQGGKLEFHQIVDMPDA